MPEVDRAVKVLDDGRFFSITYRVPGTWFLQAFLSEESAAAGDDPVMATSGPVPGGRAYLTDDQASVLFGRYLPTFLHGWDMAVRQLGIPAGATLRTTRGRTGLDG